MKMGHTSRIIQAGRKMALPFYFSGRYTAIDQSLAQTCDMKISRIAIGGEDVHLWQGDISNPITPLETDPKSHVYFGLYVTQAIFEYCDGRHNGMKPLEVRHMARSLASSSLFKNHKILQPKHRELIWQSGLAISFNPVI